MKVIHQIFDSRNGVRTCTSWLAVEYINKHEYELDILYPRLLYI